MHRYLLRLLIPACALLGVTGSVQPALAAPPKAPQCVGAEVPAGTRSLPAHLTAASWVVADLDSGDVLAWCGAHVRYRPASTLKLLTALTVLPRVDLQQTVTVLPEDLQFEPGSSAVGLVAGGTYTVETLVLGLLLVSGNDAANVLARIAGGPEGVAGTLRTMNTEAAALGARNTVARTPHGLDAAGQVTTAHDLAVIARADFARPEFRRLAATRTAQVPPQVTTLPSGKAKEYGGFQVQNDNLLLTTYPGALGGKTGFTDLARHTYVGAAERAGRRLVVTLMGAEQTPLRVREQAATLLDWGFATPADAPPVGQLSAGLLPESTNPPPAVRGEVVQKPALTAALATPAQAASGPGTALLWIFGLLAAVVALLRARVKLRLARRRTAVRRQALQTTPRARPGSGRPGRAAPHRSPGPARSRANP
jgi:D-alanyl-D-alanine carboxypeptidase (penicillin-binding protein 5/6)